MKNSITAGQYYKRQAEYTQQAYEKNNLMPRRYVLVLTNLQVLETGIKVMETTIPTQEEDL